MIGLVMIVGGAFLGASKSLKLVGTALAGSKYLGTEMELKGNKRAQRLGFNPELEKRRQQKSVALLKKGLPAIDPEEEAKRTTFMPLVLRDEDIPESFRATFPREWCLTENEAWNLFAELQARSEGADGPRAKVSIDDLKLVSDSRLEDSEVGPKMRAMFKELRSNS